MIPDSEDSSELCTMNLSQSSYSINENYAQNENFSVSRSTQFGILQPGLKLNENPVQRARKREEKHFQVAMEEQRTRLLLVIRFNPKCSRQDLWHHKKYCGGQHKARMYARSPRPWLFILLTQGSVDAMDHISEEESILVPYVFASIPGPQWNIKLVF